MTIYQKPFKGILAFLGIWNTPRLPWKDSNYEDTSLNHLLFFLERIPKPPPCGMYKTWKHSVGFKDFFHQLRIFLREGIQSFFETSPWNLSRSKQHKFSRKTERPCQAIAFFTPPKDHTGHRVRGSKRNEKFCKANWRGGDQVWPTGSMNGISFTCI